MINEHLDETKPLLHELIRSKEWKKIPEVLQDWPEPEISELLLVLEKQDRVLFFRCLPRKKAANVFSHLDLEHQERFIQELTDEDTRKLLADLSPDDRTALLEELPASVTKGLLKLLNKEDLIEARRLLGYPEESIGRLMTTDYASVSEDMTIREALRHIRETARDSETFNLIYVTDESGKLLDSLRLRKFIMADPEIRVADIMDHKYVSLSAFEDREHAVDMIKRYDLYALPVVDSDDILLGIVTVDDVLDVAEEEATEDFHKSAAMSPLDAPYHFVTVGTLFRKRIPWLLALVVVGIFSAAVITQFEETLEAVVLLAAFIPLLIDSGGNTGAQSATLMVRAISTKEVSLAQWWKVLRKELLVGLSLGGAMALACFLLGVGMSFFDGSPEMALSVGLVVGLSMVCIIMMANLLGTLLPFLLTRLKLDPAVASSPLITTICDIFGLLIYFGIAAVILRDHIAGVF